MATIKEVKDALRLHDLKLVDYAELAVHTGRQITDLNDRKKLMADFIKDPANERFLCFFLDLETEEEKMSRAAKESARWACVSAILAFTALAISVWPYVHK